MGRPDRKVGRAPPVLGVNLTNPYYTPHRIFQKTNELAYK
jgi:hypothetical protein